MKIALFALAGALASTLALAAPEPKNPFKGCWMESGPQARKDALEIPDELLQDNWRQINDFSKGQSNNTTFFRLDIDPQTRKLSLGKDQSFKDLATSDSEVIVQIGGSAFKHEGKIYGNIETVFGSGYTRSKPVVVSGIAFGELELQYVSQVKDGYRDIRLHCSYQE